MLRLSTLSLLVLAAGCNKDETRYPPPPPCSGPMCSPAAAAGAGSGGASSSSGTAGGGGGTSASVSGSVYALDEQTFTNSSLFTGQATIVGFDAMGGEVTAPYGATSGTIFTLTGLRPGVVPMFVRDETMGGSGILSTWSLQEVPSASPLQLPAIDHAVLDQIATSLPVPTIIAEGTAQIILKFRRAGAPLQGVTLDPNTPIGGATVAYDAGTGYVDTGGTGSRGTIVILNLQATVGGGIEHFTVFDDTMTPFTLGDVHDGADAASIAGFDL
jgi:hypothetical protein